MAGSFILAACGDDGEKVRLSGAIRIDGSSTVYPISQAVAEEFNKLYSGANISLGASGTGGGFESFCTGETDINDASRAIKDDEVRLCESNGVEWTEFTVAADGISIIVNPDNDWVDCLTVEQLHLLWQPDSPVKRWSDLDPSWPDKKIRLFGPGTDSGTFDYFTKEINGEEGASRSDYGASEDDNVLIQGVEGDEYALAYLGFAYYIENKERLKVLSVDNGSGCIEPTDETVRSNTYAPLSRPLFIYVANDALEAAPSTDSATPAGEEPMSTVATFVKYYLNEGVTIVPYIGYVPYPESFYAEERRKLDEVTS